jgi:membrane-associated protease RseP (regulator of RpoE activity)
MWMGVILLAEIVACAQEAAPGAAPKSQACPGLGSPVSRGAYLGVEVRDVTSERLSLLKVQEARGAEIAVVDQDSPAGKAGLKEHDVVLSFDGQAVRNTEDLRGLLRRAAPGRQVVLGISREGQRMNVQATLAARRQLLAECRPGRVMRFPEIHVPAPDFAFPQLVTMAFGGQNGLVVEDLTPQLGKFFGAPEGRGVLVRSVDPGSVAEAAGLKAGDVIVKADGMPVSSVADWRRVLNPGPHGGSFPVSVIRGRKEQTLSLERAAPRPGGFEVVVPPFAPDLEKLRDELNRLEPELQRSFAAEQARAAREAERATREYQQEQRDLQRELQEKLRELREREKDEP